MALKKFNEYLNESNGQFRTRYHGDWDTNGLVRGLTEICLEALDKNDIENLKDAFGRIEEDKEEAERFINWFHRSLEESLYRETRHI